MMLSLRNKLANLCIVYCCFLGAKQLMCLADTKMPTPSFRVMTSGLSSGVSNVLATSSLLDCARECLNLRLEHPVCDAFRFDEGSNTACTLYQAPVQENTTAPATINTYTYSVTPDPDYRVVTTTSGNKYKYVLLMEPVTYLEARIRCIGLGGYMLHLDSEEEYAVIEYFMDQEPNPVDAIWAGADDLDTEGSWVTDRHKTSIATDGMWNWLSGEPNNSGANGEPENCALLIVAQAGLYDAQCSSVHTTLCERDIM